MEQPSVERKDKKKISKIHFLIHPGFDRGSQVFFDTYVEKAKTLREDELMFAFPFSKTFFAPEHRDSRMRISAMKEDIGSGKGYIEVLRKIKGILGDRLIVVTDKMDVVISPHSAQNSWDRIKRIAEARGYYFDQNVESQAYGEYCDVCVSRGAANLNIVGRMEKRTAIKPEFTDLSTSSDEVTRFRKTGPIPSMEDELRQRLDIG